MPEDELSQSFKNAQDDEKPFPKSSVFSDEYKDDGKPFYKQRVKKPFRWFPNAPEQMKKWFNTTSGFICGVFGGFLMVALSAAVVGAVGFIAFVGIFYVVLQVNLSRCVNEYADENGLLRIDVPENIRQECRVKVGLGRSDGKDKGYWK